VGGGAWQHDTTAGAPPCHLRVVAGGGGGTDLGGGLLGW
jgi:hypothetical protein